MGPWITRESNIHERLGGIPVQDPASMGPWITRESNSYCVQDTMEDGRLQWGPG